MTRAKDSDRNDTCKVLDSAMAEGQLSMAEHRDRVSAAMKAATLGELAALVADLQNDAAPVRLPTLKPPRVPRPSGSPGWGFRVASAVVLVLLGIGIGWGIYGNSPAPLHLASDPGAQPDGISAEVLAAPRQLQSLNGFKGLFEQMHKKFGNTMGYELDIHSDIAFLDRPDPSDNRREMSYQYRGGWGDPTGSPTAVDSDARLVDLSKFDYEKALAVARGAPDTVGVKRADVKEIWLRISPSEDPATPELVNIEIFVTSEFGSGRVELYPDGTTKAIWPADR